MAEVLGLPLSVITRQVGVARQVLAGYPASVTSLPPAEVPGALFSGDAGLCLIASSFSKTASSPTRFAECLASGMPALVTNGVGDLAETVRDHRVGVVLEGEDQGAIRRSASALLSLLAEPDLAARCRRVAERLYDAESGSARYAELYRRLSESSGKAGA
jgi:glycosyltransferase involved in cell wall biosynthesis